MSFSRLFSPIDVGPMRVPNRICETTNTIFAGRHDGLPDDAFALHHVAKARGGYGWIGNETWLLNSPLPDQAADEYFAGGAAYRFPIYWTHNFVERVGAFCEAVHAEGAVAVFQLTHLSFTFGPSAVPPSVPEDWVPHALDDDEIAQVLQTYADAAARFAESGADGIEIHCAHDSLPHLFLSPATNRRTDRWGRDRSAFVRDALACVRESTRGNVALGVRIEAEELTRRGGYSLDEMRGMIAAIGADGLVDFVSVDMGSPWGAPAYVQSSHYPVAAYAGHAAAIREVVAPVKVLYAGRVTRPEIAEDLLERELCDLVGMTRAGIADPDMPQKAREGRLDDIRPCIGINQCIGESVHSLVPFPLRKATCAVNPEVGNEQLWKITFRPAREPKRIVVAGGGPAGLEAARIAGARGHEVIVLERKNDLGGQLAIAARAPGREEFMRFVRYEESQLKLHGVDVRLGVEADPSAVAELRPDAVVCATGSVPAVPEIDGAGALHVLQAWDVLEGAAVPGERVAILSEEDHMDTTSVADLLATTGKRVEIFHKWTQVAAEVDRYTRGAVLRRLEEGDVIVHTGVRATCIDGGRIELESVLTGRGRSADGFDAVVLAYGSRPDTALHDALKGTVAKLFLVGSAWVPRGLYHATQHGAKVGLDV
jgi:2,4-dienoyl-CoA reductase-like NADH-dependent reductase (Old Yellow Enzyme family)/thioredoxin reductase